MKKYTLADRLAYAIFVITLPEKTLNDVSGFISEKLISLYPDALDNKDVYIVKNGRNRMSRIVLVKEHVGNRNRRRDIGRVLCSSMLVLRFLNKKSGICIFVDDGFVEYVTIVKGSLVSSNVQMRSGDVLLKESIGVIHSDVSLVICSEQDRKDIDAMSLGVQVVTIDEIPEGIKKRSSLWALSSEYGKRKGAFFSFIIVLFCFFGGFVFYYHAVRVTEELLVERNTQELRAEKERQRKEGEMQLSVFAEEYNRHVQSELPSVYNVCRFLFFSMDSDIQIENMSVTGGVFQFDARGRDAIEILTKYEQNGFVSSIELTRVVVEKDTDVFSFRGKIGKPIMYPNEDDSIEGKISFYRDKIEMYKRDEKIKRNRLTSEVSERIGKLFLDKRCNIEMIQYYKTEFGLEIEYAVYSSARNYFNFLQAVCAEEELLDISSLRVRPDTEGDRLSSVIRFRTGIYPDDSDIEKNVLSESEVTITADELSSYFIRPVRYAKSNQVIVIPETVKEVEPHAVKNPSFLVYLGSAGLSNGDKYVLIKDTRKDRVVKIPFEGKIANYIVSNSFNSIEVLYEGVVYEVGK
jgi:hypothetical protein